MGSRVFTADKRPALRAFLSPSVVHFASALTASLMAVAPVQHWAVLGLLVGGLGVFGAVYSGLVWRSMVRHGLTASIDLGDRVWYAVLPAVTYAVLVAAGAVLTARSITGLGVLALGMGLLFLVGIRNAWDITTWTITRRA